MLLYLHQLNASMLSAFNPTLVASRSVRPVGRFVRGKKGLPPWDEVHQFYPISSPCPLTPYPQNLRPYLSNPSFRLPPSPLPLPKGTPIVVHPAFHGFEELVTTAETRDVVVSIAYEQSTSLRTQRLRAARLPFARDYATAPAARKVTLSMAGYDIPVSNPTGVTVLNVMEASARHWRKRPSRLLAQVTADSLNAEMQLSRAWGWLPEEVDLFDLLGKRVFFQGWESAKVVSADEVRLTAEELSA